MHKHQVLRAVAGGIAVMLTGLLVYPAPPDDLLAALWSPAIQGCLAGLAYLGIGNAIKSPAPDAEPGP